MQSDRELLELAAKAAGLTIRWDARGAYIVASVISGADEVWNPLHDDGQALRLAVALRINIYNPPGKNASASVYFADTDIVSYFNENAENCAAVRLAIVRAAAAIGEKEKGG